MQIAPRAGCATWRRETRSRAGAFSLGRSRVSIEGSRVSIEGSRVSIEGSRVSIEGSRAESGCSRAAGVLGELSPGLWECVAFGKPWDLLLCNGRTRGCLKVRTPRLDPRQPSTPRVDLSAIRRRTDAAFRHRC